MPIEWNNLRPLNGSQQSAFEELCCQLAAYEKLPTGSTFIRKGAPDAGVECFWILPGGDEWGWQAKYFTSPPNDGQWNQVDESVKTALAKHPRITSYSICFPINRQDPRIEQQKWFMDKWNEHVEKWQEWAKQDNKSVEFSYWGEHEIFERLSREEHKGRYVFWFKKELFSQAWFENNLREAIANVGPRYTPELNIELPIARLFDGLGRTQEFYSQILDLYGEIKKSYSKAKLRKPIPSIVDNLNSLDKNIQSLLLSLEKASSSEVSFIEWDHITTLTSESWQLIWDCVMALEAADREEREKSKSEEPKSNSHINRLDYDSYYLRNLASKIRALEEFSKSSEAILANIPALLLVGKAGTGKTHLLCDVAERRINAGIPAILILGSHFSNEEPWHQIIEELGLNCSKEEFLGALEAAALARNEKSLIFIDALNEGAGNQLWNKYLAGMLTAISRYQWIGLALTVRTSYEDTVIPQRLVPTRLIRETHYGFAEHEYQATRTFFDFYGIERPTVPLLVPEFQNPLFLKLFCLSLKNLGLTKIPPGPQGISSVFNFFVESVNEKLAIPEHLDFDKQSHIVSKAVEKIAEAMAEKGSRWLIRDEARQIVDEFLPPKGYDNSLFKHMIDEGILSEDRFWKGKDEWCEGIAFSYERFTDHLIVKYLLNKHLNLDEPSQSFSPEQPLGSLIRDERTCWQNRGLIEAFSIQLPELIGKELSELTPNASDYEPVREAFVDSLIWRDPKAITETTRQYINEHIIKYADTHDQFLDVLLTITQNPEHPYNARFLHRHLTKFELADRDAWWSIFLHEQYGQHGSVDRLVEWGLSAEDKSHIGDEPIMLCGIALSWFLTASNRFLRDKATKALVSLFTPRLHVLINLLQEFKEVNDPYVLERLVAVSYGCAMRSIDSSAIAELADYIYNWQFKNGTPIPHILLRDYARGIIELALQRGAKLDVDVQKIRPPYQSEWPNEIPPGEELEKLFGKYYKDMPDEEIAGLHLYLSVMEDDFSIYVIGGLDEWSSQRLGEPKRPTKKEIYEEFVRSLTERQRKALETYRDIITNIDFYKRCDEVRRNEVFSRQFTEDELQSIAKNSQKSVLRTLGKKKSETFNTYIIPYLDNPHEDEYRFDASVARRWMLQRVLDLGWTKERFGKFDREIVWYDRGRAARKPERIGKKYQWIAYHELLGRLSDNFHFRGKLWSDEEGKYDGPWQISCVRDIDPSCLLKASQMERWGSSTNTWWFTPLYSDWGSEIENESWLKATQDLPDVTKIINVTEQSTKSKWLNLHGYYIWEQPTLLGEERYKKPTRQIWYAINGYLCKKTDIDIIFEWAKKQTFRNHWLPEVNDFYRVFLGEFYWSPAFDYSNYNTWTNKERQIPGQLLITAERYVCESSSYDCSIDDTISIYLPNKLIVDKMNLRWNGSDGRLIDDKGSLIAFDPSVRAPGPGALLVNQDIFLRFLDENKYDIIWTIIGGKIIIGDRISADGWIGRLEISGAYRMHGTEVEGVINTSFLP